MKTHSNAWKHETNVNHRPDKHHYAIHQPKKRNYYCFFYLLFVPVTLIHKKREQRRFSFNCSRRSIANIVICSALALVFILFAVTIHVFILCRSCLTQENVCRAILTIHGGMQMSKRVRYKFSAIGPKSMNNIRSRSTEYQQQQQQQTLGRHIGCSRKWVHRYPNRARNVYLCMEVTFRNHSVINFIFCFMRICWRVGAHVNNQIDHISNDKLVEFSS